MIGYYVHHHGRGHLSRAEGVAAATGEAVVALSSLPEPARHPFADWVALAPDPALADPDDPTAGGALHWAPRNSPGYRDRMAQFADWVTSQRPRTVVVDVSVEIAALTRLLATPSVVVAGPGTRGDGAHLLAYRSASSIVAPWADLGPRPVPLEQFAPVFTGAFSRFDGRVAPAPPGRRHVLVLLGAGGETLPAGGLDAAAAATPGWRWSALGGAGRWTDDVWDELVGADVVVTHAGLGALSEVAAARRAAVVVPQDRPFGEQRDTARRLAGAGLAEVRDSWPEPAEWAALLDAAVARGGAGWSRWNDGGGAARFVAAISDVPAERDVA